MQATMQRTAAPSVAGRSSALVAPAIRPSAAARHAAFKPAGPVAQRSAAVVARAAAVEQEEPLVVGVDEATQQSYLKLPQGYHWYETMLILQTTLSDEERDKELAKFEAYLNKEECQNITCLVRGRSRMAYPIKQNWEGIYVLYTYAAKRQTARRIQQLLANPEAGSENNILRYISFCKY